MMRDSLKKREKTIIIIREIGFTQSMEGIKERKLDPNPHTNPFLRLVLGYVMLDSLRSQSSA